MQQFSLLLLLLCFNLGFAQQQSKSFSLQEAIDYALENNRTAKNAARDIEAAKQQKRETTATGLPQLDGNINYQNFLKQQVTVIPSEVLGGNPGEFSEIVFGTQQSTSATATLSQLLFDIYHLISLDILYNYH